MTADAWSSAEPYEAFMGRWSRLMAAAVLEWLDPPPGLRWLDVGCGTGALSDAVVTAADPASVVGVDPSPAYVALATGRLGSDRTSFRVGDATDVGLPDASVDRVACGLVLNFVPDAVAAVREMRRVLVPSGETVAYVWDYADGMQMLRRFWDAAVAEDPSAAALDEAARFPLCAAGGLESCVTAAGAVPVATAVLEVPTVFADFADYWTPFLGGQGPAAGYCSSLDTQARDRLRTRLQASLPVRADGSIPLVARARVVRAVSP